MKRENSTWRENSKFSAKSPAITMAYIQANFNASSTIKLLTICLRLNCHLKTYCEAFEITTKTKCNKEKSKLLRRDLSECKCQISALLLWKNVSSSCELFKYNNSILTQFLIFKKLILTFFPFIFQAKFHIIWSKHVLYVLLFIFIIFLDCVALKFVLQKSKISNIRKGADCSST